MRRVSDADAVALLRDLVSKPSVSGEERAAVELLVDRMRAFGFRAHIDDAGNAVGELGSEDLDATEVVLLGHIDTVAGWIDVREEAGELWGRGSVDAKGPLCAFVCGAADAEIPAHARVVVVGAVGEESPSSPGATYVRNTRREPSCVLIGEPSGWDRFTIGYKGRLLARAEFEQPCGHTAGPEGGVGEFAVAWWHAVSAWANDLSVDRSGPFESVQATLQSINTGSDGLTDCAIATIGLRLPTWLSPDQAEAALRTREVRPGRFSYMGRTPAHRSDRSSDPALALASGIAEFGARPRPVVKTGTSDMNTLAEAWSCPIVAYGPGDSSLDHTPQERIVIDDYRRAIGVLRHAVGALAQRDVGAAAQ